MLPMPTEGLTREHRSPRHYHSEAISRLKQHSGMITGSYVQAIIALEAAIAHIDRADHHEHH